MRADKKKSIAKVTTSVMKDPLQTIRTIAKDTWLWTSTVNRVKQEMAQNGTKDDRILWITNKDIKIVELANEVRLWYVEQSLRSNTAYNLLLKKEFEVLNDSWLISEEEYKRIIEWTDKDYRQILSEYKLSTKETLAIDKISETSQRRYSIFVWDITDDKWWLKDISDYDKLSTKELEDIRQKLLWE